jgi:hypothetical protein
MAEIAVLESAYDRAYYAGIAWERRAKAFHDAGRLGSSGHVYDWIVKALGYSRKRSAYGRQATTTRFCAGTPAFVFSSATKPWGRRSEDVKEPILSE